VSAQSFSPISPAMTGTLAMTGAIWAVQHDFELSDLVVRYRAGLAAAP
jgi:hypothetical protein